MSKTTPIIAITILCSFIFGRLAFAIEVKIGDAAVRIPAPAGFVDLKPVSKEQFDIFNAVVPKTNRLEAAFVSESDAGQLMLGNQPALIEYFSVQSYRPLDTTNLSKSQFSEIRQTLSKEYGVIFNKEDKSVREQARKSGQALSKHLGTKINFNVSGIAPLSVDDESTSNITISLLSKFKMEIEGEQIDFLIASTMCVLLIRSKVLYLNACRKFNDDSDIEWTRRAIKDWKTAVLSSNKEVLSYADGKIVPEGLPMTPEIRILLSGKFDEFKSKGHQKARKVDFSIKYPSSWQKREADRPHIVQKFLGNVDNNGIQPVIMITVQDLPKGFSLVFEDSDKEDFFSDGLKEMTPPGAEYIDGGKTKLDGEPAGWMKYYYYQERAGMHLGMYCLQYVLFYDDNMLAIQCSVGGLDRFRELSHEEFNSYLPLFQNVGINFILDSKWDKPLYSKMWWAAFPVVALMLWLFGLIPTLSTRPLFRTLQLPNNSSAMKSTDIDNVTFSRFDSTDALNSEDVEYRFANQSAVVNLKQLNQQDKQKGTRMNWYFEALKKYATFEGRARRKEYWYFALFNSLFYIVAYVIDVVVGLYSEEFGIGLLSGFYVVAILIPGIAAGVRRLHDTDRTGWWMLICFIPLLGLIILAYLVQDSKPGHNRFGPNPKEMFQ